MTESKYSPEEILQILIDFYNCQSVFDPEVEPGQKLNFETTIPDWMDICDLVGPVELTKCYHDLFKLTTPANELTAILSQQGNTLRVLCNYLAEHAVKQVVSSVMILGQNCMTASIFKRLINNLKHRGVDVVGIRPSSAFPPLFYKHGSVLLEEVNKLAPGSLSKFEYRDNAIVRTGNWIFLFFFLSLLLVPVFWRFHWGLFVPFLMGLVVVFIGKRFSPARESIGGYHTVRDLIMGMQVQAHKASH